MEEYKFGLSGFLAPDGKWYPCAFEEHCYLADELVEKYNLKEYYDSNELATEGEFIKFGCAPWLSNNEGDAMCHAFVNRNIRPTEKQIEWLKENVNRATKKQLFWLNMVLSHHGITIETDHLQQFKNVL